MSTQERLACRPVRAEPFPAEDVVDLPSGWWGGRKVLALRVRGTSMVGEGIRDGDHLIVEPRESAEPGQTVVAEVDGRLTVKRFFREAGGRFGLEPADPEMLPLVTAPAGVRIVGVVVGVFRRQSPRQRAGRRPPRPAARTGAEGGTLDLTLRVLDQNLEQADRSAAHRTGLAAARLRGIAKGLRSLRNCYLETRVPRLKAALLREAAGLIGRLGHLDPSAKTLPSEPEPDKGP